jgi:hypothetical protein
MDPTTLQSSHRGVARSDHPTRSLKGLLQRLVIDKLAEVFLSTNRSGGLALALALAEAVLPQDSPVPPPAHQKQFFMCRPHRRRRRKR